MSEREQPLQAQIVKVAAGYAHSSFLDSFGNVFTCGCGASGQLGRTEEIDEEIVAVTSSLVPRMVVDIPPACSIACGDHHSVAVTRDGELYCWGLNQANQFGILQDGSKQVRVDERSVPTKSNMASMHGKIVDAVCGPASTGILLAAVNIG